MGQRTGGFLYAPIAACRKSVCFLLRQFFSYHRKLGEVRYTKRGRDGNVRVVTTGRDQRGSHSLLVMPRIEGPPAITSSPSCIRRLGIPGRETWPVS